MNQSNFYSKAYSSKIIAIIVSIIFFISLFISCKNNGIKYTGFDSVQNDSTVHRIYIISYYDKHLFCYSILKKKTLNLEKAFFGRLSISNDKTIEGFIFGDYLKKDSSHQNVKIKLNLLFDTKDFLKNVSNSNLALNQFMVIDKNCKNEITPFIKDPICEVLFPLNTKYSKMDNQILIKYQTKCENARKNNPNKMFLLIPPL